MLSPDEVVRSCLSEIWRYRLAIQDQHSRIKAANEAVLEERKQVEKDERELLFAPTMSAEKFQERLEEIHYRDVPLIGTLKTEVSTSSLPCTASSRCRRASEGSRLVT